MPNPKELSTDGLRDDLVAAVDPYLSSANAATKKSAEQLIKVFDLLGDRGPVYPVLVHSSNMNPVQSVGTSDPTFDDVFDDILALVLSHLARAHDPDARMLLKGIAMVLAGVAGSATTGTRAGTIIESWREGGRVAVKTQKWDSSCPS